MSFLINILFTVCLSLNAQTNKVIALRSDMVPVIDGILDDEAWSSAILFSDFRMVEPNPGEDPTEKTELRVIYNNNSIIFGIKCFDSDPEKISANTLVHDQAEERNEDQIFRIKPEQLFLKCR